MQDAHVAWVFGSQARGTAWAGSDIEVIVVAPTERPFLERFPECLPAIANAHVVIAAGPEERPFLVDALAEAKQILAFARVVGRERFYAQACFRTASAEGCRSRRPGESPATPQWIPRSASYSLRSAINPRNEGRRNRMFRCCGANRSRGHATCRLPRPRPANE